MAYIFGPVRSRRLGLSLGIDLLPYKTCNLDCGYCECGATTHKTSSRKIWTPTETIIAEVVSWMNAHPEALRGQTLTCTLAGAGEPTLHSEFGLLGYRLKELYPAIRLALITNGLLFTDAPVRRDACIFDLVLPSLDAATQETFEKINKPEEGYAIEDIIAGLAAFRQEYTGTLWLEIFIVPGVNDQERELALLREAVLRIMPDRVQLNSLDRSGADSTIPRASVNDLERVRQILALDNTEIISRAH
ncbi:MAG: radical SAM protein [Spirochaetota bacterium]|jgi:wyosine [tRNA(Phe)-imidazoG37] synthetase (radical SAM superfamily)|nr:radical SAM protein [Spirochaetota bacterium]